MKIDDRSDLNAVSSPGAKGTSGVAGSTRHEAGHGVDPAHPDHAELSGLAGRISGATSLDAEQRAANAERLRLEVAQGSYRPNPADISRSVVKDALTNAASAGGAEKK